MLVGAVPLAPAVAFGGFNPRPVMVAKNVGKRSGSERAGVAFVNVPGKEQHLRNGLDDLRIISKREPRPFAGNFVCAQVWIPRQPPLTLLLCPPHPLPQPAFL